MLKIRRLHYLTYCSIECYFLDKETTHRILVLAGRIKTKKFDLIYDTLCGILLQLFSVRLADAINGWKLGWHSPREYLAVIDGAPNFDIIAFLQKLAAVNRKIKEIKVINNAVCECHKRLLAIDVRNCANGHDIIELLAWIVGAYKGIKEYRSETTIERAFILSAKGNSSLKDEMSLFSS